MIITFPKKPKIEKTSLEKAEEIIQSVYNAFQTGKMPLEGDLSHRYKKISGFFPLKNNSSDNYYNLMFQAANLIEIEKKAKSLNFNQNLAIAYHLSNFSVIGLLINHFDSNLALEKTLITIDSMNAIITNVNKEAFNTLAITYILKGTTDHLYEITNNPKLMPAHKEIYNTKKSYNFRSNILGMIALSKTKDQRYLSPNLHKPKLRTL